MSASCSARVGAGECSGGSGRLAAGRHLRRGLARQHHGPVRGRPSSYGSSSSARRGRRPAGAGPSGVAGGARGSVLLVDRASSRARRRRPSTAPASSPSRSGILLIGVAVTTSRPKTSSRTSSGTATQRGDRALQQPADAGAEQAAGVVPLDRVGGSWPMCSSAGGGDDQRRQPTRPRPRCSGSAGSRISRTAPISSSSGSTIEIAPKKSRTVSASRVADRAGRGEPDRDGAERSPARAASRPAPSRRCSGSSSRAVAACRPTARTIQPTPWASAHPGGRSPRPSVDGRAGPAAGRRVAARDRRSGRLCAGWRARCGAGPRGDAPRRRLA